MAGPRYSDIARELNNDPARWAPEIIGEPPNKAMSTTRELRFYKKGGLAVTLHGPKKGHWRHHGHDKFGDMLDLIIYIGGLNKFDALQRAKQMLGIVDGQAYEPKPVKSNEELEAELEAENRRRINAANFIWRQSGTTILPDADAYLAGRAITIHQTEKFAAIRSRRLNLNSLIKMGIEEKIEAGKPRPPVRFPNGLTALVFAATHDDGSIGAVQQIILDGPRKADVPNRKRSNGIMDNAAVRFGEPDEDLDVVEGPETALSSVEATGCPTWASLGAANFTRLPIPDSVKRIRFAMELEPSRTGISATLKAAHFWMARGKEVSLAIPRIEGDPNDVHQKFGIEAVREDFSRAVRPERNPYRHADGTLLTAQEVAELPLIFTRHADDALAAWQATGLPCHAIVMSKDARSDISSYLPDGSKKIIFLKKRDEPMPSFTETGNIDIRAIHLGRPLAEVFQDAGGEAVRRLLGYAAPCDKIMPFMIEDLAIRHSSPVIVVTGRKALFAARSLFPGAVSIGVPRGVDSATIDWTSLAGRKVYFAPANIEEEILSAEQAAEDALNAGALTAHLFEWPLLVPSKDGLVAKREIPHGFDLSQLDAEGWTSADARLIARLARRILPRSVAETRTGGTIAA